VHADLLGIYGSEESWQTYQSISQKKTPLGQGARAALRAIGGSTSAPAAWVDIFVNNKCQDEA
jgi:hypothetical protein